MRRETRPWTCPDCSKQMKEGGKGPHKLWACINSDPESRFWTYVDKSAPSGCWLWTGTKHFRGYGACSLRYGDCRAHRAAWKYTNGDIPEGLGVLHRCNNPLCVNPDHLYLGDQRQNVADCIAAGRRNHRYTPVEELLHPQISKRLTGRQW